MTTRAQITVNGVVGSDDDVTLNALVQLNNQGLGDEVSYLWTILSQPSPMTVVLSSTTVQAPTFTPNKEGSYLLQLIVNKDLPDQKIDRVVVAVRELETRNRIPAAGETTENNAETGWANTAVDQILQRVTRFTDAGFIVGKAGQADLQPFDVVYTEDVTTIATGLPGERPVPLWRRASATVAGQVLGLLGVFIDGVDGATSPNSGDIIRVAVLEILQAVQLGTPGLPRGTPVYVDNLGHLSVTPGDTIRQVGTTLDDMGGGAYGIWVTGEGTFGTLQGVTAEAPIVVTPGVIPNVTLARTTDFALETGALALNTTGVTAGNYGKVSPVADESLVASMTVDAKGRITAASEGAVRIGGSTAKVYVDAGDATTLASANAYTDARTFGLSSKVPVHTATTTALPSYTVNGTFQTLTASVHGPLPLIDGHQMIVGDRMLVKNETSTLASNNGIYVVTQLGASSGPSSPWILTRADDANTAAELCGSLVTVNVGATLAGSAWIFAFNPALFTFGATTPPGTAVVFTQLNAVSATDSVLGTVRLQGGLSGTGSTAQTPIVNVGTGNVSGTLAVGNGGTGLTGSTQLDSLIVGNGSGGWAERLTYVTSSILDFPGATIPNPLGLRGRSASSRLRPDTNIPILGSYINILKASTEETNTVVLTPGNANDKGYSLTLVASAGQASTSAGSVSIYGGLEQDKYDVAGGSVTIQGGRGDCGGPVYIRSGPGYRGGDVYIEATNSLYGSPGEERSAGSVFITAGNAAEPTLSNGGSITIQAGAGGGFNSSGGDVLIEAGGSNGKVLIRPRPSSSNSYVEISDAYVNGKGTAGQILTSNGTNTPPSWQNLGGAPGPAAFGAFRSVDSVYTMTLNDYLIYARGAAGYTVTLPNAATVVIGRMFRLKARISGITLAAGGSFTIDGAGTIALSVNQAVTVMRTDPSANTEWILI